MKKYLSCEICGSSNIDDLLGLYDFCKNCQSARIKNIPKTQYNESYYKGSLSVAGLLFKPLQMFFYWLRRYYVGDKKVDTWMDIGAGDGEFLKTVKADKKIGVEISKAGRKMMESSGLLTLEDKQYLKTKSKNVQIISFWHVLEHTEKPKDYLMAGYSNLLPNGRIIIGVPNIQSLEFKIFKQFWFHFDPGHHIWHLSPKSLFLLLDQSGFKVKKIDCWSPEHHFAGALQSFINRTSGTDNILHKIFKRRNEPTPRAFLGIISSLFWLTLGLPLVAALFIISALLKKPGTFVVVAQRKSKS